MLKKLQVITVLMCMLSYATAGTVAIGTASARGDMRVNSYPVRGNATLFDGSLVETGEASAELRLDQGTEITMATSSSGTLYRDRLVLQQGETELAGSNSFLVEANDLRVTSNEPNSRGLVAIKSKKTVEVAVLTGSLDVMNNQGVLLATVRAGKAFSFAMQTGASSSSFTATGLVSYENGRYYVTSLQSGAKFEVTCTDLKKWVGQTVMVTGDIVSTGPQKTGVAPVICLRTSPVLCARNEHKLLIAGLLIAGVAIPAIALYLANKGSSPASR
jgi:hypothetical protein